VDGLIFLSHRLPRGLEPLLASAEGAVPVVNGCEYSPELGLSSVHIDNAGAACAAIDHLLDLDHRRIGVITGSLESPLSRDRLSGVELAMRRRGPPCHLHVQRGDFSVDSGFCGAQRLINERCSAIFCFSDEMAIGALQAVREAGLNCPADISVIGFDDVRFVRYLHPPLTTIAQPAYEIGKRTVELLLDTIEGRLTSPQTVVMPYQLLVRASTAPRAKK
jgi:LacI family repressor for deo operon, udp, cdd, tsx, nupC, and nupG